EQRLAATGVNITSNNGALVITGNVQVDDLAAVRPGNQASTTPDLTGVAINGNGNQVQIDGLVSVNYAGMVASRPAAGTTRNGVQVAGDNNTLVIKGGLAVDYTSEYIGSNWGDHNHGSHYALYINGSGNTVRLSGESQFHNNGFVAAFEAAGKVGVLYSTGRNNILVLDENFRLEAVSTDKAHYSTHVLFWVDGAGSVLYNRGHLVSEMAGGVFYALNGARIVNEGSVTAILKPANGHVDTANALIVNGHNLEKGELVVSSWLTPFNSGQIHMGGIWAGNQYAAMLGNDDAAVNEGRISVRGAGTYGMTSRNGTLLNSGTIEVDGMQLLPGEDGNDSGNKQLFTGMNNRELRGAGMHLFESGTATNTGSITVTNSGTGMFVSGTGVAWNQGTINLEADGSHNQQGWLYAMAATGNGVAINDTT
ncbi:hypothetical protein, partial [Mangrovibacter plantisponsor]|uniref:hypothetical protein n=1 Tax=Mangrovibacter plantisponsor TaxID=451513 RepID=UPI001472E8E4